MCVEEVSVLKEKLNFAENALYLTIGTIEHLLKGIKLDFDENVKTNPLDILSFEEAGITREQLENWVNNQKMKKISGQVNNS